MEVNEKKLAQWSPVQDSLWRAKQRMPENQNKTNHQEFMTVKNNI